MAKSQSSKSNSPKAKSDLPLIPTIWPGALGTYKYSRRAIWLNIWPIVILYFAYLVINLLQYAPNWGDALAILSIPLAVIVYLALIIVEIDGAKGKTLEVEDAVKRSFRYFLNGIGLYFYTLLILLLSLIALVIPFFFVLPRVFLAPYYMIDRDLNFVDAISVCWKESRGHSFKVWGILLATAIISIALAITIIGIPFAIYFVVMYSAAPAVLYLYIDAQPKQTASPAAPTPLAK